MAIIAVAVVDAGVALVAATGAMVAVAADAGVAVAVGAVVLAVVMAGVSAHAPVAGSLHSKPSCYMCGVSCTTFQVYSHSGIVFLPNSHACDGLCSPRVRIPVKL